MKLVVHLFKLLTFAFLFLFPSHLSADEFNPAAASKDAQKQTKQTKQTDQEWEELKNWAIRQTASRSQPKAAVARARAQAVARRSSRAAYTRASSRRKTPQVKTSPAESVKKIRPPVRRRRRRPLTPKEEVKPEVNRFSEAFFMSPEQKIPYKIMEIGGFAFMETPEREFDTRYSLVTDFSGNVVKTRVIPGLRDLRDARKWIEDNLETAEFQGVDIRRLPVGKKNNGREYLYWVGQKSFSSEDQARAEIALVKAIIDREGGNFQEQVRRAPKYLHLPGEPEPVKIRTRADFEKEEDLILKYLDQLDIGNELFGPFQGASAGEPIVWQSFGETTWRRTNLENDTYNNQTGFWTNRLVFKGINAPLNTLDPYVEVTVSADTTGTDYQTVAKMYAGVEWRPFQRNPFFYNYRPWGIPLLIWVQSYRFFYQYGYRTNIKDEVTGSPNTEHEFGLGAFYEFGVDPPPLGEAGPDSIPEYLKRYVWGEYFGDYKFQHTGFSSQEDYNAWTLTSSLILGAKLPGIPLPRNPVADNLVLMPYFKYEMVVNDEFSFHYMNRYFVAAGVRWMPFANYRHKENEWLAKTKIFFEYVGVGGLHHFKQDGKAPADLPDFDFRFGINISQRRF